ncbi:FtsX-like permease family protein [Shewanella sp. C32]|uniref:FtsX-like permease family protein n=1 Tax=Shewanella electrica TaxID=515560 RepID=A0ABT2FLE4_9GAMM|nr:FtsX-like permease family protein [Shewanella electrica]MCH1925541.1 FtsX-like permease family protein [Shewanella electrica]MCS4557152.1 FtsX-like permease family protein [Shewanella electrica]
MFEFGPIWRTILRNKISALLIVIQVSLTLGVISNAAYVINQRQQKMNITTGIDETHLFTLSVKPINNAPIKNVDIERDLNHLRQLANVADATSVTSVPLVGGGWSGGVHVGEQGDTDFQSAAADMMAVDSHGLNTLGVNLASGRFFNEDEIVECIDARCKFNVVLLSRDLADALFGKGSNPLGKQLNFAGSHPTIIGITQPFYATYLDHSYVNGVLLLPMTNVVASSSTYLVRAKGESRDSLMLQVADELRKIDSQRVIGDSVTSSAQKAYAFRNSRLTVTVMQFTIVVVIGITILGIVGLTSLWVNQRRRQLGIRRALGATQAAIVRYFLIENLMLTTLGIVIGVGLSLFINQLMVQHYHVSALPMRYIVVGMFGVWLLGVLAALVPVLRAAAISPALATRSV